MPPKKWTIAVDFDGVLHQYTSKFDINLLDPPMPGAFEWLTALVKDFKVIIHSCRFSPKASADGEISSRAWYFAEKAQDSAAAWFKEHGLPKEVYDQLVFWQNTGKPTALIYVDDRAFRFEGHFPTKNEIHQLRPWKLGQTKKPEWFCNNCEGHDVQFVDWYDPNADEHYDAGEYFIDKVGQGRGDDKGMTWCNDCNDSTPLEYRGS